MASACAGGGAGRVEKNRIEAMLRLPRKRIGPYRGGTQAGAPEIVLQQPEPALADVERGNMPPGSGKLERLAARRGAQIEHAAPFARAQHTRGERGREILHPPGALGEAVQRLHRRAARQAQVSGRIAVRCKLVGPVLRFARIAQGKIERRGIAKPGGDRRGEPGPAILHRFGQGRYAGKGDIPLVQRREHAMRQPARTARQQRQAGRDHGVGRGFQPQPLCQHHAQHRADLGILGQPLLRRAVDQAIEIGQPAQGLVGDGAGETLVGHAAHLTQCRPFGLFQRFAPPQHGVEHLQGRAARVDSGRLSHGRPA